MSFLPTIIQKTIDQELIKQANSIKDIIYDEFQKSLSVSKILSLSNKLKENSSNGCCLHKRFITAMQETFENIYIFSNLYELIFNRFKVLKCSLMNQREKYFVTNIYPLEKINIYEICCSLSIFIKCEFDDKIKLLFELSDIDDDGFLNEQEIIKMITTLNFIFCDEETPIK